MTTMVNPLKSKIEEFFARLNRLNGFLYFVECQLEEVGKLRDEMSAEATIRDPVLLGAALTFTDLTGATDNGFQYSFPSGTFRVTFNEYSAMADALVRREAVWTVAQGYEAFESFMFDIAGAFLHANQEDAELKRVEGFEAKTKSDRPLRNDESHWSRFVRYAYRGRNNLEILKELRRLAPGGRNGESGLATSEQTNTRSYDLPRWLEAASEVRHSATHSDCRLKASANQTRVPNTDSYWFPVVTVDGERILALDRVNADRCLEMIAEYGFLIFKCLCQTKGYDWRLPCFGRVVGGSTPSPRC